MPAHTPTHVKTDARLHTQTRAHTPPGGRAFCFVVLGRREHHPLLKADSTAHEYSMQWLAPHQCGAAFAQLVLFCDIHGHSRKKNAFMYARPPARSAAQPRLPTGGTALSPPLPPVRSGRTANLAH